MQSTIFNAGASLPLSMRRDGWLRTFGLCGSYAVQIVLRSRLAGLSRPLAFFFSGTCNHVHQATKVSASGMSRTRIRNRPLHLSAKKWPARGRPKIETILLVLA